MADYQHDFPPGSQGGEQSTLNITANTVVKATPGRLVRLNVIVAGSAAGAAYDTTSTASTASSNEITAIPAVVGPIVLDWPCANGIVILPGTGQTVAVSWT